MAIFKKLSQQIVNQGKASIAPTLEGAVDTIQADGFILTRHQPNRRKLLNALKKPGCPFCRDQATDFLVEYPYHGMILSQNLAPYGSLSLILRTRLHHEQDEIIDFIESHGEKLLADLPTNTTLYCNQFAGNSQAHLHLQYLNQLLPISKLLAPHQITCKLNWMQSNQNKAQIAHIDGADDLINPHCLPIRHFWGCFIIGSARQAPREVAHYLTAAGMRGFNRFNLAAWRLTNANQFAFYIALRNPETIRTRHPQFPVLFGALTTSGLITEERPPEQMPQFDYDEFANYARSKLLPPINLWR